MPPGAAVSSLSSQADSPPVMAKGAPTVIQGTRMRDLTWVSPSTGHCPACLC
jgi:hypothetical protein